MSRWQLARIYDSPGPEAGYRVLVDGLWPRGVRRDDEVLDRWMREVAPSTELRRWFRHDPARWDEFASRYRGELAGNDAFDELSSLEGPVVLLTATKDVDRSHARVLLEELRARER